MWKRLLVPHDFSRCAGRALDVAVGLAEQGGGQILLGHVSPLPPNLPPDAKVIAPGESATPVSVEEMLVLGAYRELVAIAMPLEERGLSVLSFARVTESGSPAAAILRMAEEFDADVIVLGTHGRTGFAHLLLGSVAEQIVRRARVPVVSVRFRDEAFHPTREEALAEDELAG
jgi:nucleotide-binding universal stress UspA family protein